MWSTCPWPPPGRQPDPKGQRRGTGAALRKAPEPPMALPTPPKPGARPKPPNSLQSRRTKQGHCGRIVSLNLPSGWPSWSVRPRPRQEEAALARLREKVKSQGSGTGRYAGRQRQGGRQRLHGLYPVASERCISKDHQLLQPESRDDACAFLSTPTGNCPARRPNAAAATGPSRSRYCGPLMLASEKFTPPPDRKVFEGVFVFKREGISPNKP